MALIPRDQKHHSQIVAGTNGRNKGHWFEEHITEKINNIKNYKSLGAIDVNSIIFEGNPALLLLQFILSDLKIDTNSLVEIKAFWLGGLATSGKGHDLLGINGEKLKGSKSDIVIELILRDGKKITAGVSTKTCSNKTPTNAQLFFTTASAFCELLRRNDIKISKEAEIGLKMFCGDNGYRPIDAGSVLGRIADPERWFWEEMPDNNRKELEELFNKGQNQITEILLKKAYMNDPFEPKYLIHQTKECEDIDRCEIALFNIDKLILLSKIYAPFQFRPYFIKKGRFKNDPGTHLAPRFGVVQMQRGGQKQHPTQLQFNLKSGYFYHLQGLI